MAKTISDLREHLFSVLDGLKDGTLDVDKAKAISDTAQTIINSAKVEVDFLRATGAMNGSGFIGGPEDNAAALPPGVVGRKIHRLR